MDLVERQTDDKNAEKNVEVVLYWTTAEGGFGLEAVDDVTNEDLDNVEDEERESKTLNHNRSEYNEKFCSIHKHTV